MRQLIRIMQVANGEMINLNVSHFRKRTNHHEANIEAVVDKEMCSETFVSAKQQCFTNRKNPCKMPSRTFTFSNYILITSNNSVKLLHKISSHLKI